MATLLHDDVIDESSMRRGVYTANNLWGNKASVLVGDFLFSKAFEIMVNDGSLKVLNILSETSNVLAQGEVMQLSISNNIETSKENCLKVIEDKTAKLFEAATSVGGVIAKVNNEKIEKLAKLGKHIGTAFQLIDDAMDYKAESKNIGKQKGDDFREGKITLPVVLAITKGNYSERKFWKRVIEDLEQNDDDFEKAIYLIEKHNAIEETIEMAIKQSNHAKTLLKFFPQNSFNEAINEIAEFSVNRNF